MGRHRLRNLTPSREGITFLCWCWLRSNRCTVFNTDSLVYLTVYLIYQRIRVGREGACYLKVMGRHRSRNLTPSRESIAFPWIRICLGSDWCSVFNTGCLVYHTVYLICQRIRVDRECTCYLHIMGRHRSRYLTPSGEGIALLRRSWLGSD